MESMKFIRLRLCRWLASSGRDVAEHARALRVFRAETRLTVYRTLYIGFRAAGDNRCISSENLEFEEILLQKSGVNIQNRDYYDRMLLGNDVGSRQSI